MCRSPLIAPPLVVCGIVLSLVTGCPATEPPEPAEDPAAAREAMAARVLDFCRGYMARHCQRELECSGALEADVCHPEMQEVRCQALRQATRSGRLDFVASEADGCLAQLEGTCQDLPKLRRTSLVSNDRICPPALQGLSPERGACATWEECEAGTFCTARSASGGSCPGRCRSFGGSTSLDEEPSQCPPGHFPVTLHSATSCYKAGELGEGCAYPPYNQCVAGTYCRLLNPGDYSSDGRCEALLAEGERCSTPSHCREGLTCAGPEGARTCRPLKPVGAACTEGWDECSRGVGVTCMGGRCAMPHAGDACNTGLSYAGDYAGCFDSYCSRQAGSGICLPWGPTAEHWDGCGPSNRAIRDVNTGTISCPGACAPPP